MVYGEFSVEDGYLSLEYADFVEELGGILGVFVAEVERRHGVKPVDAKYSIATLALGGKPFRMDIEGTWGDGEDKRTELITVVTGTAKDGRPCLAPDDQPEEEDTIGYKLTDAESQLVLEMERFKAAQAGRTN